MYATWYVTEGGDTVDPAECSRKNGVLTHKSGAKIAMRFPDCPRSRSVDVKAERAKDPVKKEPFGGNGDHDGDGKAGGFVKQTADMQTEKPEPAKRGRPYKTRRAG